MKGIGLEGE